MKLRLRLAVTLAVLAIAAAFPSAAAATTTQSASACNFIMASPRVCLAERAKMLDDRLSTNSNLSDLRNVAHTLSGTCSATVKVGDDWNNCISSVSWVIPSGKIACLYTGASYTGTALRLPAGTSKIDWLSDYGMNDEISSVRFRLAADGCF